LCRPIIARPRRPRHRIDGESGFADNGNHFCNKIGTKRTKDASGDNVAFEGEADIDQAPTSHPLLRADQTSIAHSDQVCF
jgi:hypothetical protein